MSVNIKDLEQKVKKIRFEENTEYGKLEVYEPTQEQIDEIIEYIQDNMTEEQVNISDEGVLFFLIPMLTNIKFGDLDFIQVQDILRNPSMPLRLAKIHLETIIQEIVKIRTANLRKEITESENLYETLEVLGNVDKDWLDRISKMNPDTEITDTAEKLMQVGKKTKKKKSTRNK
jgi:hypothetical protein